MNEDNSLQINIEAIDDASSVLEGVAATAGEMADQIASSAADVNGSLETITTSAEDVSGSFEQSVTALNTAMSGVGESASLMAESVDTASANVVDSVDGMEGSATGLTATWEQSVAELDAAMEMFDATVQTGASAFDESMATMNEEAASAAAGIEESLAGAGEAANNTGLMTSGGLLAIGIAARQAGTPLEDFYKSTVGAATATQNAMANSTTLVQGIILQGQQLAAGDGAVSAAKKDVIDKINAQKVAIQALEAPISGAGKTIAQLATAENKAASEIALHRDTLAQLQGKLEIFNNLQTEAGSTVGDLTTQIQDQANKNIALGFTYSESIDSLSKLSASTGSTKSGILANADAMALATVKGISLSQASDALSQAYQGNGRALQNYGVIIKDGLSGSQALQAVWTVLGTEMQNQQGTMGQAVRVIDAEWNKLMSDLGNSQTGVLTPVFQAVSKIIVGLDAWTTAHPKLTQALLLFVGVLGMALVAFAAIVTFLALIAGAVALLGSSVVIGIGIIVAAFAGLITYLALNWNSIVTNLEVVGEGIKNIFIAVLNFVTNLFETWFNKIMGWINTIIQSLQRIASQVGGAVSGTVSAVGGAISSVLPHFATGGIVNGPTLAMVGEGGPEAIIPLSMVGGSTSSPLPSGLGGGNNGQGITVYITGQVYSTDDQAKKFGDAIAKQINRQLKITSFR